jgi:YVTN family beta-propeller protein
MTLIAAASLVRPETMTPDLWTVRVGRVPVALAVDQRSGHVFVANNGDQTLSILDARSGATLATVALGQSPTALTVDQTHGRVYTLHACMIVLLGPHTACPNGASSMSVLDLYSGTLLGTMGVDSGATAIAVDGHAGRIFVTDSAEARVSIFDAANGRMLGLANFSGTPLQTVVDTRAHRVFVGALDPGGRGSSVSMLDSGTGALLNTVQVGRLTGAMTCDTSAGRVLVPGGSGLYLLDARTGRTLRVIRQGGLPLAVDERDGRALTVERGQLRLIRTRDGTPVGSVGDGGAFHMLSIDAAAVDDIAGRFYVAAHVTGKRGTPATINRLFVLDDRTGLVLHTISLRATAVVLAVDGHAQRAFIVNGSTMADATAAEHGALQLESWLSRAMPWLPLPAAPPSTTGTITMLDTARL